MMSVWLLSSQIGLSHTSRCAGRSIYAGISARESTRSGSERSAVLAEMQKLVGQASVAISACEDGAVAVST